MAIGQSYAVIPGRAQHEPGISRFSAQIPGSSLRDAPE